MFRGMMQRMVAAAALVASLIVLPSMASAHSGHDHRAAKPATVSQDHHSRHMVQPDHVQTVERGAASQAVEEGISRAEVTSVTLTDISDRHDGNETPCTGGCCVSGHCAACFAAMIPPALVSWSPGRDGGIVGYTPPALQGVAIATLRRPPKLFV